MASSFPLSPQLPLSGASISPACGAWRGDLRCRRSSDGLVSSVLDTICFLEAGRSLFEFSNNYLPLAGKCGVSDFARCSVVFCSLTSRSTECGSPGTLERTLWAASGDCYSRRTDSSMPVPCVHLGTRASAAWMLRQYLTKLRRCSCPSMHKYPIVTLCTFPSCNGIGQLHLGKAGK